MAEELLAGVYRHYKGEHYLVLGLGHDAADDLFRGIETPCHGHTHTEYQHVRDRACVVYIPLYVADGPRIAFRDVDQFFEKVCRVHDCPDFGGTHQAGTYDHEEGLRFEYVGPVGPVGLAQTLGT